MVTALAVALSVAIAVFSSALASGIRHVFARTGDPLNIVATRSGADSEYMSMISRDAVPTIEQLPGIAKSNDGTPLVSAEAIGLILLSKLDGSGDSNITVRGMKPVGFALRSRIRLVQGRWFQSGVRELVISRSIQDRFSSTSLGDSIHFGKGDWTIVGVFDGSGSAQDSEVWGDLDIILADMNRPRYASVLIRAADAGSMSTLTTLLSNDKRLRLHAVSENEYYSRQSETGQTAELTSLLAAAILAIGSCFALANAMFAATASRVKEIATLRIIGFSRGSVLIAFLMEAIMISLIGGILGILVVSPLSRFTTGTLNSFTFSEVVFKPEFSPAVLSQGILLAILLGVFGGILPAFLAAFQRLPSIIRD